MAGCLCVILLVIATVSAVITLFTGHVFLSLGICFLTGILLLVILGVSEPKQKEKSKPKTLEEIEAEKIKEDNRCIKRLQHVKYLGGHESFPNEMKGSIALTKVGITFCSSRIGDTDIRIPYSDITNIIYDKSESVTLGRVVAIGIFAGLLKKKNYYFVVEYVNEVGIKNTVVFDTDTIMNREFFNEAIVLRNEFAKENKHKVYNTEVRKTDKNDIDITHQIRELAKLRYDGILTEQEFNSKKKELLEKL